MASLNKINMMKERTSANAQNKPYAETKCNKGSYGVHKVHSIETRESNHDCMRQTVLV